jgi:FkbM family methyltransferase
MKKIVKNILKTTNILKYYRYFRDLNDRKQKSIKTPWGFTLAGNKQMAMGTFEPEETQIVIDLLKEVDIFINIGANIGYYCCHALSMGKEVIAFEPIARNVHYLITNIKNNGWSNKAQIFPVALGEKIDILNIWGGDTGASLIKGWASIPENYVTQVPINTIDNIIGDKIKGKKALILIDVEGAEYFVLNGAKNLLTNTPSPVWVIEISRTELQPNLKNPFFLETFKLFFNNNYSVFTADSNKINLSEFEINEVYTEKKVLKVGNFIFNKK